MCLHPFLLLQPESTSVCVCVWRFFPVLSSDCLPNKLFFTRLMLQKQMCKIRMRHKHVVLNKRWKSGKTLEQNCIKCYIFVRLPQQVFSYSLCECPDMEGGHFLGIIPNCLLLNAYHGILSVIQNFMQSIQVYSILWTLILRNREGF